MLVRHPQQICRLAALFGLAFVLRAHAGDSLALDLGSEQPGCEVGFGWREPEHDRIRTFMWMKNLEGDLWVTSSVAGEAEFRITAVPFFLATRRQVFGLYVNDRFVAEWKCPHRSVWKFAEYKAVIPSGVLKEGRNRLTLRTAYAGRVRGRDYSLAVDRIELTFK